MLRARSAAECHLYMELHPCKCGDRGRLIKHTLVEVGEDLVARYQDKCRRCGADRRFDFALEPELPPPGSFGGAKASSLIGPGEYLLAAERWGRSVPAQLDTLNRAQLSAASDALEQAIAAINEVFKFIVEGGDRVDHSRFDTQKELFLREPGRFRRDRLHAVLASYESGYAAIRKRLETVSS